MSESRRSVMVGGFVLVGLASLALLVTLFGRGPAWLGGGDTYPLNLDFPTASGIRPGNNLTVGGITIGRVREVSFENANRLDAGIRVGVQIQRRFRLTEGTVAIATEPGFGQGRPAIEIVPGSPDQPPLADGATIAGRVRGAMDTLLPPGVVNTFERTAAQIGNAAEALTPALREIDELLKTRAPAVVDGPGGPQGNLSSAMARLDATLKHFNEVIGDPAVASQLREIVANTKAMTEDGKVLMGDLKAAAADSREFVAEGRKFITRADSSLANLDTQVTDLSKGTRTSLEKVSVFLDHLNVAAAEIGSGKGTIGKLIMEDKLYEGLVLSAQQFAQLCDEFKILVQDWQKGKIKVGF